jgi:hypothetical protein
MEQPQLLAVDGNEVPRTLGRVQIAHPGIRFGYDVDQAWRTDEARLNTLYYVIPVQGGPDRFSCKRTSAIASNNILGSDFEALASPHVSAK